MAQPKYSIIIPVHNESESLPELIPEIAEAFSSINESYEMILINDGSSDNSIEVMKRLKSEAQLPITIINFITRFGKADALQAGFDHAQGEYIFTMDADLQDDPAEVSKFIDKMQAENLDMVSGWKFQRLDPISKTLPSTLANGVMKKLSGVKIHDMNCGFKLYTKAATQALFLYGDMHRFIPAILASKGLKIGEVPVNHRKRKFGKSKYGVWRLMSSFFDFLTIIVQTKFLEKPLHFFGLVGMIMIFLSLLSLIYLAVLWLTHEPIGDRPLFLFSLVMFSLGLQIIMTGLIADLVIRRTSKKEYTIKEIVR